MERTEEFLKIVTVFKSDFDPISNRNFLRDKSLSQFMTLVKKISTLMEGNKSLVSNVQKLSQRKEFSNDPTSAMTEIANLFSTKALILKNDLSALKAMIPARTGNNQQQKYHDLMFDSLNKRQAEHTESFKIAIHLHTEHVKQREQRVSKYGQGMSQLKEGFGDQGPGSGGRIGGGSGKHNSTTPSSSSSSSSVPRRSLPTEEHQTNNNNNRNAYSMFNLSPSPLLNSSLPTPPPPFTSSFYPSSSYSSSSLHRRRGAVGTGNHTGSTGERVEKGSHEGEGEGEGEYSSRSTSLYPSPTPSPSPSSSLPYQRRSILFHSPPLSSQSSPSFYSSTSYSSSHSQNQQQLLSALSLLPSSPSSLSSEASLKAQKKDRLDTAERVEGSIVQMSGLFVQLSSLISSQSTILERVEDDVEDGLTHSIEGHSALRDLEEITKGNRGIILKIFGLLIVFIFLFTFWFR